MNLPCLNRDAGGYKTCCIGVHFITALYICFVKTVALANHNAYVPPGVLVKEHYHKPSKILQCVIKPSILHTGTDSHQRCTALKDETLVCQEHWLCTAAGYLLLQWADSQGKSAVLYEHAGHEGNECEAETRKSGTSYSRGGWWIKWYIGVCYKRRVTRELSH